MNDSNLIRSLKKKELKIEKEYKKKIEELEKDLEDEREELERLTNEVKKKNAEVIQLQEMLTSKSKDNSAQFEHIDRLKKEIKILQSNIKLKEGEIDYLNSLYKVMVKKN